MFTFNFNITADLSAIIEQLNRIERKLDKMPTKAEFDAAMAELDAATNEVAADLQRLIDQGFISQEGLDTLNVSIAKLKALGAAQ